MKALILNSGMGTRMGVLTSEHPKCMTELSSSETILSRQLKILEDVGITEVIITTGYFDDILVNYCNSLDLSLDIHFVKNDLYSETNYIYSIYCAREYLNDDIVLMHGDMVFENRVFDSVLESSVSCMVVSSAYELPEKDFKAVVEQDQIICIGVEYFDHAIAAQPLYKILKEDWKLWLNEIVTYCERGETGCYAEKAFNEISKECKLYPLDVHEQLCNEIDNQEDLAVVTAHLRRVKNQTVYMCFSTDMLHSGHISIIKKAQRLGRLIIGVLSDEAVSSYKRFPLLPFQERKALFENIVGVYKVVEQRSLSYRENLRRYEPTYVVHGDDWKTGFQRPIRDEVVEELASYGGRLVEYPFASDGRYQAIENHARANLSLPDMRRTRLKMILGMKQFATAIEVHNGLTGLLAENTTVYSNGETKQFDAMWISSLCDSTAKGKPDIELVDMTSRIRTIDEIMEVTTKPIIFDGDSGGLTEHFVYTVRTLERLGVSMIIIEDKIGLKKNSLFGTDVMQTQDSIENFSAKIKAGKKAQKTQDFMICARIESLILEKGMKDALLRARAFVAAGADAIMIHSRKKEPDEVLEFSKKFREIDQSTPLVVVPTTYDSITEDELKKNGINIVIYANQLMRAGFPAMQKAATMILENQRAKECDEFCMPIKDIITLIPEEID